MLEQKNILILEDTCFSPNARGRSLSTLKTQYVPAYRAAEVVIYLLPSGGIRLMKNTGQQYVAQYEAGDV